MKENRNGAGIGLTVCVVPLASLCWVVGKGGRCWEFWARELLMVLPVSRFEAEPTGPGQCQRGSKGGSLPTVSHL